MASAAPAQESVPAEPQQQQQPAGPAASGAEPPPADDPASSQARLHFSRGVELYEQGELALALAEFERAHDIRPNVHVLYNIGQLSFELRRYARARAVLERYLAEGRSELPPERVSAVERDLLTLAERTAVLRIRADVPDAQVSIDGVPARNVWRDGYILDVGERSVRLSKPGHQSAERHGTFAGGDEMEWEFHLPPLPQPAPAAAAPPPPLPAEPRAPAPADTLPPAPEPSTSWVSWAITGALAAGWATAGVITLRKQADKDDLEANGQTLEGDLLEARSSLKTWAVVTDVLLASALASAGVSAYLTFVAAPAGAGASPAAPGAPRAVNGARIGAAFEGTF